MVPGPRELVGETQRGTQPNGVSSELCNCDVWVTHGV